MFFKTLHKYTDLLCVNSKKSLETIFNDMVKYDSRSTLSRNFFEFYRYFETYIAKLKSILITLDKDIIEPLNLFNKHINGKYSECLIDFKNVKEICLFFLIEKYVSLIRIFSNLNLIFFQ